MTNAHRKKRVVTQPHLISVEPVQSVLPLTGENKRRLQAIATDLKPHRDELIREWVSRWVSEAPEGIRPSQAQAEDLATRTLDSFLDRVGHGKFNEFLGEVVALGQRFFKQGLLPASLILAVHFFEEASGSRLIETYNKPDELRSTMVAQDKLIHNMLALISATHYEDVAHDLRERNRELSAIVDVTSALSSSLQLEEALEAALLKVMQTMNLEFGEILVLDESGRYLVPRAWKGLSPEFALEPQGFRVGEGVPGIAVQIREPVVVVDDIHKDPRFLRKGMPRALEFRSIVAIPLISGGRVVGVMDFFARDRIVLSEGDLSILLAVGNEIGIAIENSRLFGELRERTQALEDLRRRREEFISIVTHEFRGPLSVILGYAQLALKAAEKGARPDPKMITPMLSQGHRLARLVDDLADVSHIESGHFELARTPTDVVSITSRVVREQQVTTEKHRLSLDAEAKSIKGNWDADRIAQVLTNLVSNAIKFSPEGGTVTVTVRRADDEARIGVQDQGIGIAPEDMSQLFQPFSKLYRKHPIRGTGLGLYITKGIIEAHGGRIWVESTPGVGSTFNFTLPLGQE